MSKTKNSILFFNDSKNFDNIKKLLKSKNQFNIIEVNDLGSYNRAVTKDNNAIVLLYSNFINLKFVNTIIKNFNKVPHILITEKDFELRAVNLLDKGLKDYLISDNLIRLVPAINREIQINSKIEKTNQIVENNIYNEIFFKSYINQFPSATIFWDLDFKVKYWSKSAEVLFGYSVNEAKGKTPNELTVVRGSEKKAKDYLKDILNQAGISENINETKTKSGETFICHWYNVKIKDVNGNAIGIISTAEDISEQRYLKNSNLRGEYFLKQSQKLSEVYNIEISLNENKIFLDENFIKISGLKPKQYYSSDYLFKYLIQPEDKPKLLKAFTGAVKNKTKLAFDFRVKYLNNENHWVNLLVDVFNYKFDNKKSLLGTFIDVTERKEELIKLKEQNNKLDLTVNLVHLGFLDFDIKTNIVKTSGNANKIFSLEENKSIFNLDDILAKVHPNDIEKVEKALNLSITKNKHYKINHRLLTDSGKIKWVNNLGRLEYDKEKTPIKLLIITRDVTVQIKRERKLLQHSIILNQINSLVLVMNPETDFTFVSPTIQKLTGYSIEEILGQGWWKKSFLSEKDSKDSKKYFTEINGNLKGINKLVQERRVLCKDLTTKWFSFKFSKGMENSLIVLAQDISKEKEKELLLSKLFKAIENSPTMVLITDIKGNIEFVNPKFEKITGYKLKEIQGLNPSFLKTDYTSEKEYRKLWNTITNGKTWHGEFKNRKKNGDILWEDATITAVKDSDGIITNYIALKEDITEKKQAEKRLLNALFEAQENEKQKFGEELHDSLSQILSAMSFYMEAVLSPKNLKDYLKVDYLEKVKKLSQDALRESRHISHGLMSKQLISGGLIEAVKEICNNYNVSKKIKFNFEYTKFKEDDLSLPQKQNIFRIIQEISTNTVRHSRATEAIIKITIIQKTWFILEMNDNGLGIKKELLDDKAKCFGLKNIEQRVKLLNGYIDRESNQNIGTNYHIKIPIALDLINTDLT